MSPLPDSDADLTVVSIDPASPIDPELLIADILRTRYCPPGSVFLVEAIDTCLPVGSRYRAVRIVLGDGELCVQALLRPEIHCFVDGGQVYEGCYVRVDDFELKEVDMGGGGEEDKNRQKGKMVYLLVKNLVTVGWNRDYLRMLGVEEPARPGPITAGEEEDLLKRTRDREHPLLTQTGTAADPPRKSQAERPVEAARDTSDSEDGFESLQVSAERAAERRIRPGQVPQPAGGVANKALPWMSNDPTQPLKLTNLASIPKLPYKQNWVCNVLAVIASLSDVEPSHLPPYTQRTARLADPTTAKKVLLTVFLDAERFTPEVGSVVLLIGVKNHRFDGGSLKKYVSDKPKNGTSWWVANPETLGWCEGRVMELREWWEDRKADRT